MEARGSKREARKVVIDGAPCVQIDAASGEAITFDAADWSRLQEAHFGLNFCANRDGKANLPCIKSAHPATGRYVSIARWIAGAGRDEQVRYRDGDRFNLRRSNLALVARWGKRTSGNRPIYVPEERADRIARRAGAHGEEASQ